LLWNKKWAALEVVMPRLARDGPAALALAMVWAAWRLGLAMILGPSYISLQVAENNVFADDEAASRTRTTAHSVLDEARIATMA
jgi:hypothetical protein